MKAVRTGVTEQRLIQMPSPPLPTFLPSDPPSGTLATSPPARPVSTSPRGAGGILAAVLLLLILAGTVYALAWPTAACQEDAACWDCRLMGNGVCGGS